MDRKWYVSLLVLLGVALALAGPVAGDKRTAFAGTAHSIDVPARQLIWTSKLEDGVAPELTVDLEVHRRVLAGGIGPPVLYPDRQACIVSCPGRGGRYTPHPDPATIITSAPRE